MAYRVGQNKKGEQQRAHQAATAGRFYKIWLDLWHAQVARGPLVCFQGIHPLPPVQLFIWCPYAAWIASYVGVWVSFMECGCELLWG